MSNSASPPITVSIITVCKNAAATIEQAIQSVITQTYPHHEYIIIDGDSQDNTKEIIQRYAANITRCVSEPDSGVYQAMNKGIELATGAWLYFVNADDYFFDANVLHDLVEFIAANSTCDVIYGDHEARYTTGDSAIHQPATPDQMLEEMVSLGNCLIQPACCFKADVFKKLGGFDETYRIAADYEWFARLLQSDLKLCYFPRTLISYSHGGLSSNIPALFAEVFAIQNQMPLYQQEPWLSKRTHKLQQSFIEKYDLLERTHKLSMARLHHIEAAEARIKTLEARLAQSATAAELEALRQQNQTLQARISAMETSKFWQIRQSWFKLKRLVGLPTNE
jgi:glycosyltransferase involved in cell wall biosynthesis